MKVLVDESVLRDIPEGESFVCLFSGGKDSGLALSMALETGRCDGLIHYLDHVNQESIFHKQKKDIIQAQARALGMTITYHQQQWWADWKELSKTYLRFRNRGVKYVVFGDLNGEENAKTQIILCQGAGLIPCFPLWKISYEVLISEIEKRNIKSIITTVNHHLIESKWLGKVFDRRAYEHFISLGVDPFGEGGEFHTTLVDADCFAEPLEYMIEEMKMLIHVRGYRNE